LLILDERWEAVPTERIGDLYIRGLGLSPGYWRDPDRTREVFLSNPHSSDRSDRIYKTGDLASMGKDGLIYFHGRADDQIKSRGFRIELGEIETALNSLSLVGECAVVSVTSHDFEGSIICCAYVGLPDVNMSPTDLRREMGKILPSYMLPSLWMTFDELPKNINGKIDRRALKEEFSKHEAPANRKPGNDQPGRGVVVST
jgi:acyl-coenzyme A synthetase/AMP-(fatty) acid ligase